MLIATVKEPKTFEEQANLIKKKGFLVDDESSCIDFLQRANYYRLSAYLLPFKTNEGTYFPNIEFSRIKNIYEFDGKLRSILFQCIEEIEFYLRTQFAYFSAHKHGPLGYLEMTPYSTKHDQNALNERIQSCIDKHYRTQIVQHHLLKYDGKFPVWVIIEFFSMGMLSYFYSNLKSSSQKQLSNDMYNTSPSCLKSWLRCLTDLRNRCAHYSRLYFWSFSSMPKLPIGEEFEPNRKLFTQIMVLKYLYPEHDKWNEVVLPAIRRLVEEYQADISLKHIGFPSNWDSLLQYK